MVDPAQQVEVRRSARRRRTVSAYRDGNKIVVLMPARITRSDERRLVAEMVELVTRREATGPGSGPATRHCCADRPNFRALPGRSGTAGERALGQQHAQPLGLLHAWPIGRSGCPSAAVDARLGDRLRAAARTGPPARARPRPGFWAWVNRYPRTERARGYLEGVAVAAQLPGLSNCDIAESERPDRF